MNKIINILIILNITILFLHCQKEPPGWHSPLDPVSHDYQESLDMDGDGVGAFLDIDDPQNTISLISPIEKETLDLQSGRFSWEAVVYNNAAYQIQVAKDIDFTQVLVNIYGIEGTETITEVIGLNQLTGYWRVRVHHQEDITLTGNWSEVGEFTSFDNRGPQLDITSHNDGDETVQTIVLEGTAGDKETTVSQVIINIDKGNDIPAQSSNQFANWSATLSCNRGIHTIKVTAIDEVGNLTQQEIQLDSFGYDAVYVRLDGDNGNLGTPDSPLATINAGVELAHQIGAPEVAVAQGTYEQTVEINHPIKLYGSYSSDFTSRNPDNHSTILAPQIDMPTLDISTLKVIGLEEGIEGEVVIEGFTVNGAGRGLAFPIEIDNLNTIVENNILIKGEDSVGNSGILALFSNITFRNNDIYMNDTAYTYTSINRGCFLTSCSGLIENNRIFVSTGKNEVIGIYLLQCNDLEIKDNQIDFRYGYEAYGIKSINSSSVVASNTFIGYENIDSDLIGITAVDYTGSMKMEILWNSFNLTGNGQSIGKISAVNLLQYNNSIIRSNTISIAGEEFEESIGIHLQEGSKNLVQDNGITQEMLSQTCNYYGISLEEEENIEIKQNRLDIILNCATPQTIGINSEYAFGTLGIIEENQVVLQYSAGAATGSKGFTAINNLANRVQNMGVSINSNSIELGNDPTGYYATIQGIAIQYTNDNQAGNYFILSNDISGGASLSQIALVRINGFVQVRIEKNELIGGNSDSVFGIDYKTSGLLRDTLTPVIVNNLIKGGEAITTGCNLQIDGSPAAISNNTFILASGGISSSILLKGGHSFVLANNLLVGNQNPNEVGIGEFGDQNDPAHLENNLMINVETVYQDEGSMDFAVINPTVEQQLVSSTIPEITSLIQHNQSETGYDLSTLFLDPSVGDYQLISSSIAVDQGTFSNTSLYGIVVDDIIQAVRPYNTFYDIGCYEYVP